MEVEKIENGVPIKSWTDGVEFEDSAREQVRRLASMPFVFKHVAVMPDVHFGLGATVGSVFATQHAIIPAAVGVDIGCGMVAAKLSVTLADLPDTLTPMREAIERAVPVGTPGRGTRSDQGSWHDVPSNIMRAMLGDPGNPTAGGWDDLRPILSKHPKIIKDGQVAINQCGTLGGGNHFIELCADEEDNLWVMLHSGSRGIGNKIGEYFIELAREDMRRWFINLPDKDLAYFPEGTEHYSDYVEAMLCMQNYAHLNRQVMLGQVLGAVGRSMPGKNVHTAEQAISCHHNYVEKEHHFGANVWVTRKGAVRAREGDLGIIPGSMGTRSYIVRGRGNPESFHSCSHGAGRRMSRAAARRAFTVEDHQRATEGVECRKDEGVLDETPGAYKSIDAVIEAERDLIDVVHTLRGLLCVKG